MTSAVRAKIKEMKGSLNEAAARILFEIVSEEVGIVGESNDHSENIFEAMVVQHESAGSAENFNSELEEDNEND